ncbi:putative DMT superfamily transporter inner membrane protein [Pseudovibrio axinellae]|uniref:Putative DMT superfamily transporter inner membrane protein n=1 Tax=Pseudovibrio axinellae TaxID=989403 RepID=A0A165XKS4_9HYPH|nr:EamA family transporter RarD [Pseudovibrio axinellae]KZL17800.1 putative DMT superfamily transporter inner membrane protein [Pseudovibrio axinellae]SEP72018.1 chloramphenicol-sensitive protein RarD [Pseudovibrio axinellae]
MGQSASVSDQLGTPEAFKAGLIAAVSAYLMWGFAPMYYKLTADMPAIIVICYRVIGSVLFLGSFMALRSLRREVFSIFGDFSRLKYLLVSASVISINWTVFIWAVETGRVLDASLGYFINPLVSVGLGVLLLSERLTKAQLAALAITVTAVVYKTFDMGELPWVSVVLALSFALYGLMRKKAPVGAVAGQLVEVLLVMPFAVAGIWYFAGAGTGGVYPAIPLEHPLFLSLLLFTGVITAVPLVIFAFAARRLPMVYIGFLQYVAPSIHFLTAIWLFGEELSAEGLFAFAMIWLSLVIFSIDGLMSKRRAAKLA